MTIQGKADEQISHGEKDGNFSDNIFADLGLADAEEYNAKAQLAYAVRRVMKEHGLTQNAAALRAGVKQPDISNIVNGNLDGIGMERLTNVLNSLDQNIIIQVEPTRSGPGRTFVRGGDVSSRLPIAAMERHNH